MDAMLQAAIRRGIFRGSGRQWYCIACDQRVSKNALGRAHHLKSDKHWNNVRIAVEKGIVRGDVL